MNGKYTEADREAIKKLDAFLPDKIFDAHMHISNFPFGGMEYFGFREYYEDMLPLFSGRSVRCNALVAPCKELKSKEAHLSAIEFMRDQLDEYKGNVGAILVKPGEAAEEIESHLVADGIKGLKCYHTYAEREKTFDCSISEYLPEAALEVANKRRMFVTIHLVKDSALADPENMKQIKDIAKKYPDLTLVLAHSARAFAAWTAIETVSELRDYENVWYDFSAICESPSIMQILKTIGTSRCMWGSDYNVSMIRGKAVSMGEGFCWLDDKQLETVFHSEMPTLWRISIENLMAVRQAAQILEIGNAELEDIFYNNAARLFG